MPRKCVHCGAKAVSPVILPEYETQLEHDGRPYTVRLQNFEARQCANCQELTYDDDATDRLVEALRAAAGIMPAKEIRRRRVELGFTQKEMAGLLQISESTLSRWETGAQMQQRSMDLLLRAFFAMPSFRKFVSNPAGYTEESSNPAPNHPRVSQHVFFQFQKPAWDWTERVIKTSESNARSAFCLDVKRELVA